ncbi:hypothetical protein [Verrucomicrobium spinosum]|uniref:hypothetical protein n=1 Tax=Verrucomicrobium spinosum TaxID=2736 RepID=UPI0012E18801|nr:hypothetical protein [Verrucomicrobium spinosum]
MREVLAELDVPDPEHPDAWLTHESGWTLSIFSGGSCILSNSAMDTGPQYLEAISRAEALQLWIKLSRGQVQDMQSLPWKDGNAPPFPKKSSKYSNKHRLRRPWHNNGNSLIALALKMTPSAADSPVAVAEQ